MNMENIEEVKALVAEERARMERLPGVVGTGITHSSVTGMTQYGTGYQLLVMLEKHDTDLIAGIPPVINGVPVFVQITGPVRALHK